MDQCLLYQLPDEILQDKFMVLLAQSDLAAIRQASKLLYNLSTRVLYRRITLAKPSQLVKCCKTVMDAKFRVEMVHEFWIDIRRSAYHIGHFVLMAHTANAQSDTFPPADDSTSNGHSKAFVLFETPLYRNDAPLRCSSCH